MHYWLALGVMGMAVSAASAGVEAEIAKDRMLVVDGKRTFVLGIYENPADDAIMRQIADAGFNLIQTPAKAEALDRAASFGLHAWINTGASIDFSVDRKAREKALEGLVADYAGHPALLAWEVPDEALWNCWYGAMQWRHDQEPAQQRARIDALQDTALKERLRGMQADSKRLFSRGAIAASERMADEIWRMLGVEPPNPELNISNAQERSEMMCKGMIEGYHRLKGLDAKHPVWMNHAPRNSIEQLAAFNRGADIVGCDIYPVPAYRTGHSDLMERSIAAVGAYTDRMQDAAPGKPVWMVLQGFAWSDLEKNPTPKSIEEMRVPTFAESRFMAYDAIVHGARGILYWGTAYTKRDGTLWADLLKLVRELADLQPVLSAPDGRMRLRVERAPTWGSGDRTVRVLPKAAGREVWLIVVNESLEPMTYTVSGLSGLDGTRYHDPQDDREAVVKNGSLSLDISPQSVQVLRPEA